MLSFSAARQALNPQEKLNEGHDPQRMLHGYKREAHGAILTQLAQIVDAGALKPLLDETNYGLADVGKAHARLSSGQAIGKVVIGV